MNGTHLTCECCEERIGVYEPTFWQQPDGSIVESGYLTIITDPRAFDARSRFYHRNCLQTAQAPAR